MKNYLIGLLVLVLTGIIVAVLVVSLGIVNIGNSDPVVAPTPTENQTTGVCGDLTQDEGEECDFDQPVECLAEGGYKGIQACDTCKLTACETSEVCGDQICNGNENGTTCALDCSEDFSNTECSDGVDNDSDGSTDCNDLDCLNNNGTCDPSVDSEEEATSTETTCSDSVDNDSDGKIDCEDSQCLDSDGVCDTTLNTEQALITPDEPVLTICEDGLDNDSDGLIDCEDLSCRDEQDVCDPTIDTEENDPVVEEVVTLCNDKIDNDADGFIDCNDVACQDAQGACDASIDTEFSSYTCDDGIDNDSDGKIDCLDSKCISATTGKCVPNQNLEVKATIVETTTTDSTPLPDTAIEIDTLNIFLFGVLLTLAGFVSYQLTLNHYLSVDSAVGNTFIGRFIKRSNSAFFETSTTNLVDEKIEKINNSTNEK